jgi:hypothetical protein
VTGLLEWLIGKSAVERFGEHRAPSLPFAIGTWYFVAVGGSVAALSFLRPTPFLVPVFGLVMLAVILAGSRLIARLYLRRRGS